MRGDDLLVNIKRKSECNSSQILVTKATKSVDHLRLRKSLKSSRIEKGLWNPFRIRLSV